MAKRYEAQGLSKSGSRDKQRCGAKLHGKLAACRRWPVPGKTRCRLHGGLSTGARTPEGKARVTAALVEGRRRWLEEMRIKKNAGLLDRFPGGRKAGERWVTARMRKRKMDALKPIKFLPQPRDMTYTNMIAAAREKLRKLRLFRVGGGLCLAPSFFARLHCKGERNKRDRHRRQI
jgi:hypothetical protein